MKNVRWLFIIPAAFLITGCFGDDEPAAETPKAAEPAKTTEQPAKPAEAKTADAKSDAEKTAAPETAAKTEDKAAAKPVFTCEKSEKDEWKLKRNDGKKGTLKKNKKNKFKFEWEGNKFSIEKKKKQWLLKDGKKKLMTAKYKGKKEVIIKMKKDKIVLQKKKDEIVVMFKGKKVGIVKVLDGALKAKFEDGSTACEFKKDKLLAVPAACLLKDLSEKNQGALMGLLTAMQKATK